MTDEAGNLLDRDTTVRQQRDEAMPQLARRPVGGIQARGGSDLAERATDVRGVQLGANRRGEDKVVFVPAAASGLADLILTGVMEAKNIDAALRKLKRPARLQGLGLALSPDGVPAS